MNFGEHMNWMMGGLGATSMLIMMLFHIAVFVGFVYFIIYLVKISKEKQNSETPNHLIILEERFAKGEINEEEFKRMKKVMTENG
ncbi:SHOCT domain-containing protein [Desertibacillus haloalkaliphilus]|uniref:SHOCT domain-containing protein n=1 Tax=Desertibacillus haloalkaliphilus TaxID=1328930 RepID=UPI0034D96432